MEFLTAFYMAPFPFAFNSAPITPYDRQINGRSTRSKRRLRFRMFLPGPRLLFVFGFIVVFNFLILILKKTLNPLLSFPSLTAATDCHVPPLSVCAALPTAQACAYYPPCALHPPHASCSSPVHLSGSRQDCQVHQPGGNDITGLLLWLLCPLWHPWGRHAGLTNGSLEWVE